jgi:hypothetical protein
MVEADTDGVRSFPPVPEKPSDLVTVGLVLFWHPDPSGSSATGGCSVAVARDLLLPWKKKNPSAVAKGLSVSFEGAGLSEVAEIPSGMNA